MADLLQSYNLAAIRKLLCAAFTAKDLRRFCQDRPAFRPILDNFGSDVGLNDAVDKVIIYCDKRDLFDELLAEVKEYNPNQYARFELEVHIPAQMRADYLAALQKRFEYLDLGGIAPRVQNRTVKLRMADVFVPLQARPEIESRLDLPEFMADLPEGEIDHELALRMLARTEREAKPVDIPELLRKPRVVVLGDPGCGVRPVSCWYECLPQAVTVASL